MRERYIFTQSRLPAALQNSLQNGISAYNCYAAMTDIRRRRLAQGASRIRSLQDSSELTASLERGESPVFPVLY